MDCNLPCGESLVRQFTEGQSFFSSEFGIHCEEFWLPDTFGYPAQLPQLMRLSGITRFLTQKLSWNLFNKFPHSTFVWQGLDAGPGVVTHFPPADTYNAIGSPAEVIKSARGNKDAGVFNSSVMLVGHGDGGGGASPAMIECINRMRDVDGVPKVKFATPGEFFEAVEEKRAELPRWQMSELYFELHRGTFTAQAGIKRDNFECEVGLLLTETLSAFAMLQKETSFCYPEDELRRLWRLVLLNQFHDTLPGSSIGEVYREAAAMHKEVLAGCKVLDKIALKMLCGGSFFSNEPAVALNGNGSRAAAEKCPGVFWPTGGAESVGEGANVVLAIPRKAASDELLGSTISQMTDGEEVLVAVKRPTNGIGVSKLDGSLLSETQVGRVQAREEGGVGFVLENSVARVVIRSGIVQSFVLVGTGGCPNREVIPEGEGGGNQFWLYDDVPMFWDAW